MKNLEDLLAEIGNANRFQVIMTFFVKMPMMLAGWTMEEMSFVKAEPDWCCVPRYVNVTQEDYCENVTFGDECPDDPDDTCSHRLFEDGMDTMVNEWDLVCDDEWKVNLSISIQMAGVLVGCLVTGFIADFFGRKKTFFVSILSLTPFSLGAGFSPSLEVFMVFRALLGLSCGVYLVVSIPYMMEFVSPYRRGLPAILPVNLLGYILMTLVAWQLPDWRWVHWLCAAFMLPFLASWFFIPESLRWLTIKGKLDEAEEVVDFIARVNRKPVPVGCRKVLETVYDQERKVQKEGKVVYSYLDIYRGWDLFKTSVIFQVMWFIFSLLAYGMLFGASTLDLNLYLNLFLMSAVPIPVYLLMLTGIDRFGRKPVTFFLLLIATLCASATVVVYLTVSDDDGRDVITNILCLVVVAFMSPAWDAVVVLNNESYPTVLRSLGYAAANTVARIGGILAPFVFDFDERPVLSYAIIAGSSGLCMVLVMLLKETQGLDLQDTLYQVDVRQADNVEESQFLIGPGTIHVNKRYGLGGKVESYLSDISDDWSE